MFSFIKFRPLCSSFLRKRAFCSSLPQPNERPHVSVTELPNGLRVVTDQSFSFMSAIAIYVAAGPRHEHSCNNGITHLISHLAFKGNKSQSQESLEQYCLENNIRLDVKTYRDMIAFRGFFINADLAYEVFDILAKIVNDFKFNKEAFDREKYNMCVEAVDYEYNPRKLVFDYLHKTAFQCTSMGQTIIGPTANFQKFNEEMVSEFTARQFQPNYMVVAGTGNISHQALECYASKAFHKDSDECQPSNYGSRYVSSEIRYRDDSMPYVHVAVAVEAPCFSDEHYFTMLIAKKLMGSWHRSQGGGINNRYLLAQAGACDDLCYYYEPFYLVYRDVGLWGVYYVADPIAADDLMFNIHKALMNLNVTITKHDIQLGTTLAVKELLKREDNVYSRIHDIAKQVMYSGKRKRLGDYRQVFERLDKPSYFKEVVDKYIYDRDPVVAAVGPTEALMDLVRIRAGFYWIRF